MPPARLYTQNCLLNLPQYLDCQKISEIEAFLRTEVENRQHLHKKYRRAVNALEATCGALGGICIATGAVGAGLLALESGLWQGLCLKESPELQVYLTLLASPCRATIQQKRQNTRSFECLP